MQYNGSSQIDRRRTQGRLKANLALVLLILIFGAVWVIATGKDWNWDFLNYHYYVADLLIRNRWGNDYFAASIQSYLNPLSFVPLYFLIKASFPDIVVAIALTMAHLANILLIIRISNKIFTAQNKIYLMLCSVLLAAVAPLFLVELGSTFNDITTSIFVLWALAKIIELRENRRGDVLSIGLLIGAAAGLKLTNVLMVLPSLAALFYVKYAGFKLKAAIQSVLTGMIGVGLGFLVTHGYWSWKLWVEFKSPFFPFFNQIFRAADYPAQNIRDLRFMGSGMRGIITFPFEMARSESWTYAEISAPDLRFAVLIIVAFLALYANLDRQSIQSSKKIDRHATAAVCIFFVTAYLSWVAASRIGRYALPLWLLLGPLIVAALSMVFRSILWASVSSIFVFSLQLAVNVNNKLSKWVPIAWSGRYFDPQLPREITNRAIRLFSVDNLTMSVLVPSLKNDTSVVNLTGLYTLAYANDMAPALKKILSETDTRPIYVMRSIPLDVNTRSSAVWLERAESPTNQLLKPYGFVIDGKNGCLTGEFSGDHTNRMANHMDRVGSRIFFCPLARISEADRSASIREVQKFDFLFDRWERACPEIFSPVGTRSINSNGVPTRNYFNTVNSLSAVGGQMHYANQQSLLTSALPISAVEAPEAAKESVCPALPNKRYLD